MKPNGFVAAASITSHGSTPIFRHAKASSLARAIFTLRNVFSSNFAVSATRGLDTSNTRAVTCRYSAAASSVHAPLTPPTTFGMFAVVNRLLPGSTRSGENARKKSCPSTKPFASRRGCTTSSVVPGYVVLSNTISCPARRCGRTLSTAERMNEMSGSLLFRSGVGTQMIKASAAPASSNAVVAVSSPFETSGASVSLSTSTRYDSPRFRRVTRSRSRSIPRTTMPAFASSTARLSPTYPSPITLTRALRVFSFSRRMRVHTA